jgi:hypothetical protein
MTSPEKLQGLTIAGVGVGVGVKVGVGDDETVNTVAETNLPPHGSEEVGVGVNVGVTLIVGVILGVGGM